MNVKRLDGAVLNFWVAKSGGLNLALESLQLEDGDAQANTDLNARYFNPSANWSHAGPIVANEWYGIEDVLRSWFGVDWNTIDAVERNALKWFMRAYVASMFGEEVEDVALGDES
jgi:hypothetical protein